MNQGAYAGSLLLGVHIVLPGDPHLETSFRHFLTLRNLKVA